MGKGRWLKQASVTGAAAALVLTWVMPNGTLTAFASGTTQVHHGVQKEDTNSVLDREKWFDSLRKLPNGQLPKNGYQQAQAAAKAVKPVIIMHPYTAVPGQSSTLWTPVGPSTVKDGQTFAASATTPSYTQNVSGRVTSIAVSGSNLYVGAADGGVWGTTYSATSPSASVTWSPLSDSAASLAIGSVAVDPNNSSILYAGTGEEHFSLDSYFGHGVLKSTDGGSTWTLMGQSTFEGQHISKVLVSSLKDSTSGDSIVYVASDNGVYESNDGGNTWTSIEQVTDSSNHILPATDLVMSVSGSTTTLYAAFWSGGIYEATNAGSGWSTWTKLGSALPTSGFDNIALAMAPSNASHLYAAFSDSTTDNLLGFYTSTDGGTTWTQLTGTQDYFNDNYAYTGTASGNGQGFYDNVIAVDPKNENHVFAGGTALMESNDGGQTWTNISAPNGGTFDTHPDQHALTFDANGNLFVGNDGGVWELTSGGTELNLNTNLAINQMYPGISTYNNGQYVYAGSQDNGTNFYDSSSGSAWTHVWDGDGSYTYIDPTNPNYLYQEANGQISELDLNNNAYTDITPVYADSTNVPFVIPFQVSKFNSADIMVGADRLYESTDGGVSYQDASPEFTDNNGVEQITTFARSYANPNVIYVGTNDGGVYLSTVGPSAAVSDWKDITPTGADAGQAVTGIAIDPAHPAEITVTYGGYSYTGNNNHVYWTNDATSMALTNISGTPNTSNGLPNSPVDAVVQDGSTIYVGTDVGVFQAGVGQSSWSNLNNGLPNTPVVGLTLGSDGTLIAATHGRGAFVTTAAVPPALSVSGSPTSLTLHQSENLQATYGTTDVTGSAAWTSSNPSVAQVSSSGVVTAEAPGTATVAATYAGQQATFQITVVKTLTGITASLSSGSIQVKGAPATLTVTAHYDDGSTQDVTGAATIQTSNANAAVLGNQVYGGHGGTDTLTITYQGQTTSVSVGVTAVLQKIGIHLSRSWVGQYGTDSIVKVTAYYTMAPQWT